jgi:hypothetical protein
MEQACQANNTAHEQGQPAIHKLKMLPEVVALLNRNTVQHSIVDSDTEFFFLRLQCSETMAFHHCRGLLLNCEKDMASGQISYTRVAVGWASHPVWHEAPGSVVRLK